MENQITMFEKSIKVTKLIIENKIRSGDIVVDATAGNGNDTLFLSNLVGNQGKVYAFDIQEQAINTTSELLIKNKIDNVILINQGHQLINEYVNEKVNLVMFNLGFLPKYNREICTKFNTTILAIQKSMNLLLDGGLILINIYPGHKEGLEERIKLLDYARTIDQVHFNVVFLDFINQINNPPVLLIIEKRG